ncbi:hypothetical protein NMG46_27600 [Mesorhizobium sp. LMG 17147]|uniref:hypothetical protein n=1 Tax=Mesorhizobium sp. LMG 17147 TaxID=2963091 RepID=UPI0020C9A728|nr:hypothetical protein [Mesorhizobium sp. LMG 17147]MCP9233931.1 hypothetical protein [Mesorhizobium sp. LMG 17147]
MDIPDREKSKGTSFAALWETPSYWPRDVHRLPLDLFDNLGRGRQTNELYWDGSKLVTEKRFSGFERGLAVAALILTGIGVAATIVQAWASVQAL